MRRHTKDRPADRTVCKRSNNVPIATIVTNCQSRSGRESRTMMDWVIVSTCSMKFQNGCLRQWQATDTWNHLQHPCRIVPPSAQTNTYDHCNRNHPFESQSIYCQDGSGAFQIFAWNQTRWFHRNGLGKRCRWQLPFPQRKRRYLP